MKNNLFLELRRTSKGNEFSTGLTIYQPGIIDRKDGVLLVAPYDKIHDQAVDRFIFNSEIVRHRILKYYGKDYDNS